MLGPSWPMLGLVWTYVGLCWPMLDARWPMLGHVGPMLGLCWGYVGAESARTPNPISVLDSPPCPHVPPCDLYIYRFVGLGGKRKEIIKEKMIRLRKEGSLLDGFSLRSLSVIYVGVSIYTSQDTGLPTTFSQKVTWRRRAQ